MKLEEFNYHLPAELIAQEPSPERDDSRMLVVDRMSGAIEESVFHRFPRYLKPGDVVVVNDSKVIPARLTGRKATGGVIEVLLLSARSTDDVSQTWEVLLRPAKRIRQGDVINFHGVCEGQIIERLNEKKWLIHFMTDGPFDQFLDQYGKAPLPPYIKRKNVHQKSPEDKVRYQTIYARVPGSIAAPTAGFHFSKEVMETLGEKGIQIARITLHVGYGTFLPIETDNVEDHEMEEEYFEIGPEEAQLINDAQRVIAVGTTSTRALESAADEKGKVKPMAATTRLFIYPGYGFKCVNAMVTNFHLPKSSLYLLVCAFAGKTLMESSYQKAINNGFRFYSYGDCMLIQ
ncbi:MAG: tRNA preQ1(34) S-adenosylmethionine ribosyltransferase-isomerase QueA [Deltaproteobacteria bacterium]|nr:tRNA preQ1(34) S-adenosylmethionine ribosyltransferase-isomerase QueA [Deltaproteobacteria bacterium]